MHGIMVLLNECNCNASNESANSARFRSEFNLTPNPNLDLYLYIIIRFFLYCSENRAPTLQMNPWKNGA